MIVKFTKEQKWSNLLAKSAMVSILVFSMGTGSVLASEITTTTPSSSPASMSDTQNTTFSSQVGTTLNESKTETPDLLPGDFFYFVKTIYENIRLALTVNDVKEARLLTAFAQDRLQEANALLAQGKTKEANLSLQKSLETQQSAVQKTGQASGISTTVKTTQEATKAEDSTQQETTTTAAAQPNSEQTVDPEQTEAEDLINPITEVKNPEQVLKVKVDLQHNIVALASALEKVGNPKAQLALMKNIEKSFAHLDKKLSKIEKKEKLGKMNENVTAKEEQTPVASLVPSPVPTPVSNEPVSDQEKQESLVTKSDQAKKDEDNQHMNKPDKAKEKKNDSQHKGSEKGNGNGHDKNKGSKQE
ncbi:DUF5667 domain-containing protein [Paenibacillus sp. Soil787]|uniref:DUF5667 domain-containing protein n=1 Tax=Paenibacillus sp. Soil787 TaxID=1736411 RepID=UPI00070315B4|nr:DUF5667 domain-containing protein [Paenibacillus sp. Soil787]KRF13633.1 hypothetical protein ASG93_14045 [Paenibacillus sp. Soil787]